MCDLLHILILGFAGPFLISSVLSAINLSQISNKEILATYQYALLQEFYSEVLVFAQTTTLYEYHLQKYYDNN